MSKYILHFLTCHSLTPIIIGTYYTKDTDNYIVVLWLLQRHTLTVGIEFLQKRTWFMKTFLTLIPANIPDKLRAEICALVTKLSI